MRTVWTRGRDDGFTADPNTSKHQYSDFASQHSTKSNGVVHHHIHHRCESWLAQFMWLKMRHYATPYRYLISFPILWPLRHFVALSDDCAAIVSTLHHKHSNVRRTGPQSSSTLSWWAQLLPCSHSGCHPSANTLAIVRQNIYLPRISMQPFLPSRHGLLSKFFWLTIIFIFPFLFELIVPKRPRRPPQGYEDEE